jgi:hypothetical protein
MLHLYEYRCVKTERANVLLLNLLNFTRILLVRFTFKEKHWQQQEFPDGVSPTSRTLAGGTEYTSKHRQIIYHLLLCIPSLFHSNGKWERDKHNGWFFLIDGKERDNERQRQRERKRERENNLKNEISSMTLANWMRMLVKEK